MKTFLASIWLLVPAVAQAALWYAATNGTEGGAGTLVDPLSIWKAIGDSSASPVQPGDTLYIRGGTYYSTNGHWGIPAEPFATLSGTPASPIEVRPYPGESPVLESSKTNVTALVLYGSNVFFYGLELWNSATPRNPRDPGINVQGRGNRVINCQIHDVGVGIYVQESATNTVLYGNLVYNYGDFNSNQKHGIYAHSMAPDGVLIQNNIIENGAAFGIHCYSAGAGEISYDKVISNIVAQAGSLSTTRWPCILVGGDVTATNVVIFGNKTYFTGGSIDALQIGYSTIENGTAVVVSNYCAGGRFTINHWTNLTFTANTFSSAGTYWWYNPSAHPETISWDGNEYHSSLSQAFNLSGTPYTFTGWKTATGFDSTSSKSSSDPATTKVFVHPNVYESGRAHIAVYNWQATDNVSVDLSGIVQAGSAYTVRNAADWGKSVVASGVYAGGSISLPMTNLTAANPVGTNVPPSVTGPDFNVFVLNSTPPPSILASQMRYGQIKGSP